MTRERSNQPLSFKDVFKRISGLALPMALSFTFSFEVFFAVLLLQNLSESDDETAAATLVSVTMSTVCAAAMSPLFAVAIVLSNRLGDWREAKQNESKMNVAVMEQKKEKIEAINMNALLIAAVVTIPATLILSYSRPLLTQVFFQKDAIAASAEKFLRIYSFAVPGLMVRMSLEQILFSFGKTKPAMWMALVSLAIGMPISIFLGFGVQSNSFKIPKMGSEGIALGFLIESYLTPLFYGLFINFNKELKEFNFYQFYWRRFRNNIHGTKEILRLSVPISFTVVLELTAALAIGVFSGLLGTIEQSAMSYNLQFIYFEFVMLAAFSLSCTQEMSRALGAKKLKDVQMISKYGLITTLIYLVPIPFIFMIYPKILIILSGGASSQVSDILKTLVPIMSASVILDTIRYNLLQQSRAFADLFIPNSIAFLGLSGGIGLAAALGFKTSMRINGVGIGYSIGVGITGMMLFFRWKHQMKQLTVTAPENHIDSEEKMGCEKLSRLINAESSLFSAQNNQPIHIMQVEAMEMVQNHH